MKPSYYLFLVLYFFFLTSGLKASTHQQHEIYDFKPSKLFVFGDSYADTGNVRKSLGGGSWKVPYGITFPGKPAGRFSDGRVLTDYFARFLGLKSPIAYEWRNLGGLKKLRNGMNVAYGGSGVFDTMGSVLPNMTVQIDFLQKLIDDAHVYTTRDLQSSVVLVALSGNDYAAYITRTGSIQGLENFIPQVINQLSINLRRIHELGANKIFMTSLQPLGCLPRITVGSSYQQCNTAANVLVNYHNLLLKQAVDKLNNETGSSSTFSILNLYDSFNAVLVQKGNDQGDSKFDAPLKPCCSGVNGSSSCGSVDDQGNKMYELCSDPKSYFFWDNSHPTQAGWREVFMNLKPSIQQFFKSN